jgi:ribosomal protein L11 methyltransferase
MINIPDEYTEVRVEVPRFYADAVCNFIIENIANGIVLEDEEDSPVTGIQFYVDEEKIKGYKDLLSEYLTEIFSTEKLPVPTITERKIKNVEWIEEYKASVKPIRIAGDIVVRPQWHAPLPETEYEIIIEPRMAFGTGSHETTRSCLQIIRENFGSGMRFLDLGTGSGILSILASKMGASYIKAIDYDLAAVQNARENFEINSVTVQNEILFGSIEKCEIDKPYEFVCANIIKSTILPMIPRLLSLTCPDGFLILSGLLQPDEPEITSSLQASGQKEFRIHIDNKWLTYIIRKR